MVREDGGRVEDGKGGKLALENERGHLRATFHSDFESQYKGCRSKGWHSRVLGPERGNEVEAR